jgi:hypothetical protein
MLEEVEVLNSTLLDKTWIKTPFKTLSIRLSLYLPRTLIDPISNSLSKTKQLGL